MRRNASFSLLHPPILGADREPPKGFCTLIPLATFRTSQGIFTVDLVNGNRISHDVKRRISNNKTTQNDVILKINVKGQTPHFGCDRSSSEIKDDHHVNKLCWVCCAFLLGTWKASISQVKWISLIITIFLAFLVAGKSLHQIKLRKQKWNCFIKSS